MKESTAQIITTIQDNTDNWTYFDPRKFAQRLNRALRLPHIAQAYHEASEAFAAVKRWDVFRDHYNFRQVPRPFTSWDGSPLLKPRDVCTTDLGWDRGPGRPAVYQQFVCSQGCHWFCVPNLALAEQLFPDYSWVIVNSPRHSTVVCFEERVVFDLTYFYSGVSMESCLEMLFGDDLSGDDAQVYDGDEQYSYLDGTAAPALHLFKMLDEHTGDMEELLKGMRATLEQHSSTDDDVDEDEVEEYELGMATISTHLITAGRLVAA